MILIKTITGGASYGKFNMLEKFQNEPLYYVNYSFDWSNYFKISGEVQKNCASNFNSAVYNKGLQQFIASCNHLNQKIHDARTTNLNGTFPQIDGAVDSLMNAIQHVKNLKIYLDTFLTDYCMANHYNKAYYDVNFKNLHNFWFYNKI